MTFQAAAAGRRTFDMSESCQGAFEQDTEPPKAQSTSRGQLTD